MNVMEEKAARLGKLLEENPDSIPVDVAAKFLGTTPDSLRAAMCGGTCPFGYSWKRGARSGFCIPSFAFYSWLCKGVSLDVG